LEGTEASGPRESLKIYQICTIWDLLLPVSSQQIYTYRPGIWTFVGMLEIIMGFV